MSRCGSAHGRGAGRPVSRRGGSGSPRTGTAVTSSGSLGAQPWLTTSASTSAWAGPASTAAGSGAEGEEDHPDLVRVDLDLELEARRLHPARQGVGVEPDEVATGLG